MNICGVVNGPYLRNGLTYRLQVFFDAASSSSQTKYPNFKFLALKLVKKTDGYVPLMGQFSKENCLKRISFLLFVPEESHRPVLWGGQASLPRGEAEGFCLRGLSVDAGQIPQHVCSSGRAQEYEIECEERLFYL